MQTKEEKIGIGSPIFEKVLSRSVNTAIEVLITSEAFSETTQGAYWEMKGRHEKVKELQNSYWKMQGSQDNFDKEITSDREWKEIHYSVTGGKVFLPEGIDIKELMLVFRARLTNHIIELLCDSNTCEELTYDQIGELVLVLEPLSAVFDGNKENLGFETEISFCPKAKEVMDVLNEKYSKILRNEGYDEFAFIMDLKEPKEPKDVKE